jgi:hypothetical protein
LIRILLGLGASFLVAGCLLVTSFEGLQGGQETLTSTDAGASDASETTDSAVDGAAEAMPEEAAPPTPILFRDRTNAGAGVPRGIALSRDGVYWAETKPVGILFAPKVGNAVPVHVDSNSDALDDVFDVAVDDKYLYWSEYMHGTVQYKPLGTPGMASKYFNGAGHAAYLGLVPDPADASIQGQLYLTDYNTTIAAIVQGPASLSVDNSQKPPAAGITSCSGVYWAWGSPSSIASIDTSPGSQPDDHFYDPPNAVDDAGLDAGIGPTITGLACDGPYLYWIENKRSIQRLNVLTRTAEPPLYTADADFEMGNYVGDIAVDDTWIYFTEPLNRRIYKLAKPLPDNP